MFRKEGVSRVVHENVLRALFVNVNAQATGLCPWTLRRLQIWAGTRTSIYALSSFKQTSPTLSAELDVCTSCIDTATRRILLGSPCKVCGLHFSIQVT